MKGNIWICCSICRSKTRLQIRKNTELKNFPLYCPKCKKEPLISACWSSHYFNLDQSKGRLLGGALFPACWYYLTVHGTAHPFPSVLRYSPTWRCFWKPMKPNWTTVLLSNGYLRLTRRKSSGAARWTFPPTKPPCALPVSFWKSITASSAAGASCPTALRVDGKTYMRAKIPRCGAVRAGLPAYHRARHHPGGQRFQRHKNGKRSYPWSRRKENPLRHKQLKYVCNSNR